MLVSPLDARSSEIVVGIVVVPAIQDLYLIRDWHGNPRFSP